MKNLNVLFIFLFLMACKSKVRGLEDEQVQEPPVEEETYIYNPPVPPTPRIPFLTPTQLLVTSPLTFTEVDSMPTVEVRGVASGVTVRLYIDQNCSRPIAEGIASDVTIRLKPSQALYPGTYYFYASAHQTAHWTSGCSGASPPYVYSLLPLPLAPTALALVSPRSSSGTTKTPTLLVSGVKPGEDIRIYTNASCTTQVGMGTSLGSTVAITTSPLAIGTHNFYASSSNSSGLSPCSSSSVSYTYGLPPAAPSGLNRFYPSNSTDRVLNPIITVFGVSAGMHVRLFKDPSCFSFLGEAISSGSPVNITTSQLGEGVYNFYANATNAFGTSECSIAKATYQVVATYPAVSATQLNAGLRNSFLPCGIEDSSIEGKILHCSKINHGSTVLFDSITGATWKLVTKNVNLEMWKDMKTGLVWSGSLGKTNWCQAAGDASGVLNSQCSRTVYQPQYPNAESFCEEAQAVNFSSKTEAGVNAFATSTWKRIASSTLQEHWSSGTFHPSKGYIGTIPSTFGPAVSWRLPSKTDIDAAYLNGLKEVVFAGGDEKIWSSSVYSMNTYSYRWLGDSVQKKTVYADVGSILSVRCVFYSP